jgi:hypothetical protein
LVYGSCRLKDAIEGDGLAKATFMLNCDRGPLEMAMSLEEGRIASVKFTQSMDAACLP